MCQIPPWYCFTTKGFLRLWSIHFYGVLLYLLLFPISLRALVRARIWSRANITLGITALVMFIVANIYFFIFLRLQTSIIEVFLTTHGGNFSNRDRLNLAEDGISGGRVLQALPRLINFVLGDGIIVHRAFVILKGQSSNHPTRTVILRATMVVSLLISIGISIYDGYLSILLGTRPVEIVLAGTDNVVPDVIAVTLSLFTNAIATISIATTKRHQILPSLVLIGPNSMANAVSRVFYHMLCLLVLLTETAALYCFLKFLAIIFLAIPTNGLGVDQTGISAAVYLSALNLLSAIFPTVLIAICSRQSEERPFGIGVTGPELHYAQKGATGSSQFGLTAILQPAAFISQMVGPRGIDSSEEPDVWKKEGRSYVNLMI
ncbi:hypothetical protein DL96DRAFT_201852 [Flagelloscypha sp. PMI_526]|nr:hypothetical protein DL96DRAFT_201852 [Flagelloscypha sp. PMI_526]